MILGVFSLAGEQIEVIVKNEELLFRDSATQITTTIEGLKLSKSGALKEFPDLKNNNEWKKIVIEKLKDKIKSFKTENQRMFYVKEELIKWGYEPKFWQRAGHRPKKF